MFLFLTSTQWQHSFVLMDNASLKTVQCLRVGGNRKPFELGCSCSPALRDNPFQPGHSASVTRLVLAERFTAPEFSAAVIPAPKEGVSTVAAGLPWVVQKIKQQSDSLP